MNKRDIPLESAIRAYLLHHEDRNRSAKPGDFCGEMALFQGFPRSATVRAIEDSQCLVMTRGDFMGELKNHPKIAVSMLPALVRRLRNADARIVE